MYYIYSTLYRRRSFAGKLARMLGIRAGIGPFPRGSRLLCWGRSAPAEVGAGSVWLNHTPDIVANVANKLSCFQLLKDAGVLTVDWTTDKAEAQQWLADGRSVYERHKLTGHSGEGITLRQPGIDEEVGDARLYTRRVAGRFDEYRIHVVAGDVICAQQKRKMSEEKVAELGLELPDEKTRYRVRTYGNGWVFAVNDVTPLSEANQQTARDAMRAVQAGSGCVDMAVTEDGRGFVIEINSAPALRSDTVARAYARRFHELIQQQEERGRG